jgi:hypothetical protein
MTTKGKSEGQTASIKLGVDAECGSLAIRCGAGR